MAELGVTPPDSLVKFDAPLFVGIEPTNNAANATRPSANEGLSKLDDMISAMLPPREWVEESGVWIQHVSSEPASRLDIVTLQEKLDRKLAERKARDTGICPVLEQLYGQCMDELIRQVALDGPERGLLLMRVRDELKMTTDAYKTLFASSVVFGIKKQLRSEQGNLSPLHCLYFSNYYTVSFFRSVPHSRSIPYCVPTFPHNLLCSPFLN